MWLFIKNININQFFKNLDYKLKNSFKVIGKKNILLELQLS